MVFRFRRNVTLRSARRRSVWSSSRLLAGLVGAWLACVATPVGAQCNVPADVWRKPQPNGDENAQMRACVESHLPALKGEDIGVLAASRRELTDILADDNLSVQARLVFNESLQAELAKQGAGADQARAINAVRLAGEIATDRTIAIVYAALDSKDATVRYAACSALGRALRTYGLPGLALGPQQGDEAITRLSNLLKKETDPKVLDAIVRSLATVAALQGPPSAADELSLKAIRALCDGITARLVALDKNAAGDDLTRVFVRAGEGMSVVFGARVEAGVSPGG